MFKLMAALVKKNPIVFMAIPFFIVIWFLSDGFIVNDKNGVGGIDNLSMYNFDQNVAVSEKPVLVDFGASWCGPCKKQMGVLKKFVKKYHDVVVVYKVDVSKEKQLAGKYKVNSIPTLVLFLHGEEVDRAIGFQNEVRLAKMIKKHIKPNKSVK